jgi:hypothetical protein
LKRKKLHEQAIKNPKGSHMNSVLNVQIAISEGVAKADSENVIKKNPDVVNVMVRMPHSVHMEVTEMAKKERRGVGTQVLIMIEEILQVSE